MEGNLNLIILSNKDVSLVIIVIINNIQVTIRAYAYDGDVDRKSYYMFLSESIPGTL